MREFTPDIQIKDGEIIEEKFIMIDNLRVAVLQIKENNTLSWWRAESFFTIATVIKSDDWTDRKRPETSTSTMEARTTSFMLHLSLPLGELGGENNLHSTDMDTQFLLDMAIPGQPTADSYTISTNQQDPITMQTQSPIDNTSIYSYPLQHPLQPSPTSSTHPHQNPFYPTLTLNMENS